MTTYYSESGLLVTDETYRGLIPSLRKLGAGVSRTVYALSETEVLKVANVRNSFAGNNQSEWDAYFDLEGTDLGQYLARCIAIADDGEWMVSERIVATFDDGNPFSDPDIATTANESKREFLTSIARLLGSAGIADLHGGNVGWRADGTAVVVDYAFNSGVNADASSYNSEECECSLCRKNAWHGMGQTCTDSDCSDCAIRRQDNAHDAGNLCDVEGCDDCAGLTLQWCDRCERWAKCEVFPFPFPCTDEGYVCEQCSPSLGMIAVLEAHKYTAPRLFVSDHWAGWGALKVNPDAIRPVFSSAMLHEARRVAGPAFLART